MYISALLRVFSLYMMRERRRSTLINLVLVVASAALARNLGGAAFAKTIYARLRRGASLTNSVSVLALMHISQCRRHRSRGIVFVSALSQKPKVSARERVAFVVASL